MALMNRFIFKGLPAKVRFGRGEIAQLGSEVQALGLSRVAVLTTPHQAETGEQVVAQLGSSCVGLNSTATMHTPLNVTEAALAWCEQFKVDGLVSVGGGSTIGLGKAIALRTDLPQICVPTTYAGSEMTDILGQTVDGRKSTQRGKAIQPEVVVYDPDLTDSLPIAMSVTSGFNAIAHAVEALYAKDCNPIIEYLSSEGIQLLTRALPKLEHETEATRAREDAMKGAWYCGVALGSCSMALHHKLAHVLGGTFNLPHAESHTALLPYSLAFNEPVLNGELSRARRVLETDNLAQCLFDLAKKLGAPTSLAQVGMPEDGLESAADIAVATPYPNPRPLTREGIRDLLDDAFHGRRPN